MKDDDAVWLSERLRIVWCPYIFKKWLLDQIPVYWSIKNMCSRDIATLVSIIDISVDLSDLQLGSRNMPLAKKTKRRYFGSD